MDNYCKLWCNSYRLWIIYHIIHWKNHTSPATLLSIANFFPNMSGQSPEKSGLRRFLPTLAKLNQLFIPKILMFLGLNHDFTNMFKHGVRWLFRFRSPFFPWQKPTVQRHAVPVADFGWGLRLVHELRQLPHLEHRRDWWRSGRRPTLQCFGNSSLFVVFRRFRVASLEFPHVLGSSLVETWNLIQGKLWELSEKLVA